MTGAVPPLLDIEAIDQLRMLERRRPGMLQTVVQRYVEDIASKLAGVDEALRSSDSVTVRDLIHSLKGDSRLLGAELAASVAERIELNARAGDLSASSDDMVELRAVLQKTEAALLELPECKALAAR
jgi:HPt (histidine-containing phosphotransfer) domain-containing protein